LTRRVEQSPVDIEVPSVIAATDSLLFATAVLERRLPMRATAVNKAEALGAISKEHEIFAKNAKRNG